MNRDEMHRGPDVAAGQLFDELIAPDPERVGPEPEHVEMPGVDDVGAFDRALEGARRTFDEAARRELYAPVFQAISKEVPVVFLYFSDYLYAQSRQVQGLRIAPLTDPRERFWNVEDWYVKTQPKR